MKICHIITGLHNGGAEGALYRLCTAQWPAHYQHVVISLMVPGIYVERLEKSGISVHCLSMPNGKVTLKGLLTLYRLLKTTKPDVVQTWMYHADLLGGVMSRLCGIRNIAWGIRHANLDPGKNVSTTLFVARVCAILSRWLPVYIISCSQFATLLHRRVGYRADKFINIPNGYLLDQLLPNKRSGLAIRASLTLPDNTPVLGMVGRFDPQKDHNNLVEALALLKQRGASFICLLVGTNMTEDNKTLVAMIEKANITNDVKLLGVREDIPAIMNALDIHVLSSLGEAFPNVLAEAMACGTPCVTTDVGDAAFIVDKTGWVVPSRNAKALADAIAEALDLKQDQEAWEKRQKTCRQYIVDNFSLAKMVTAYQQVWEAMVARSANDGAA